ncbi:hypothetical protein BO70DRAFT_351049 [Aspergillus heteromorphus CBS 117.55]|uniref:Zn(2)-C6 fungal-type domain-containing protein n=1 Tax=Aspergillus heteromorphus CBS 117.55 TaxID=1448321 RepID=A0A317WTI3_9EURO|nr:uncharacterized protein BO70DRAFT_351049 [Aspergillus heteromorphus CBS 117.55]PWY87550.1 hypothetical protein BO70DRAFT_351049 [Aspergillus heteromorphus CBS 117.55]
MTEGERRRRRPAVSCLLCRRRKIKCNRETPCSNCVRTRNETCVYENHDSPAPPQRLGHNQAGQIILGRQPKGLDHAMSFESSRPSTILSHQSSSFADSPSAPTVATHISIQEVQAMKSRIQELEEQLDKATRGSTQPSVPSPDSNIEIVSTQITGVIHVQHDHPLAVTRRAIHKSRMLGQSYWIIGLVASLRDIFDAIDPLVREESALFPGVQKCKALARIIKSRRAPKWPSPLSTDLPPKDLADKLVDCYLQTTETIYPILHVPSFRRDYEALWSPTSEHKTAFLVQVKLVLAIGATTYDEHFSLRSLAVKWVYEAQTWLAEPEYKSRFSIQAVQIHLLLLLAREAAGIGPTLIWISFGELLRTAIHMGLHRDPTGLPKGPFLAAEMRRRLWNTILEISLQTSMTCGGPLLMTSDDFDTEPPSNFDDEQLIEGNSSEDPAPNPDSKFTRVTIARTLRKTFPLRAAIVKFLNDMNSHGTYEETLRLDAQLRASYKDLCQTLQAFRSNTGPSPSQFAIRAVDFLMHRYLSSLHLPFFFPAMHETSYAYSRKVTVDICLKMWRSAYQPPSLPSSDKFARFVACGSGLFRTVAMQASIAIAVELKAQLQEDQGLSPAPLRPDLLCVIDEAKAWCLQCIEAGETNIKGYLVQSLLVAQIRGMMQGISKAELPNVLVGAAEEAEEEALAVLTEKVSQDGDVSMDTSPSNVASDLIEDWDFDLMMADTMFNSDDSDPMNWVFPVDVMQESLIS